MAVKKVNYGKRKGFLGGIKDIFKRSSKKKREVQAKKDLKAEGTYGTKTEITQKKMDGGARRSYNKMVKKTNKSIDKNNKGIQDPRMPKQKMEKLKRGTMTNYEKTSKVNKKDQVANRAASDLAKKRAVRDKKKAVTKANKIAADKKYSDSQALKAKNTAAANAASKKAQMDKASAKWKASGGYSKAKVKAGEYTRTLTKSEIPGENKKRRSEAYAAARKKSAKGGNFTYQGFDKDGNKKTYNVRYGTAMSNAAKNVEKNNKTYSQYKKNQSKGK